MKKYITPPIVIPAAIFLFVVALPIFRYYA